MSLRREIFRDPKSRIPFETVTVGLFAAGANGSIFVYDDIDGVVHVFDSLGIAIKHLGARGSGPGEFRATTAIALDSAGGLWAFDLAKRAFVRFSTGGAILPEQPISAVHAGGVVSFDGVAPLLVVVEADTRSGRLESSLIRLRGESKEVLTKVQGLLPKGRRFAGCRVPIVVPHSFTPTLRWAASDHSLAVATSEEYRIEIRRNGGDPVTVGRDISPEIATSAAAATELSSHGMSSKVSGCEIPLDVLVESGGFDKYIPVVTALALSPIGILWVQRRGPPQSGGRIDIFSRDGLYQGTLPPETPFPGVFVSEDQFLSVTTDSDGVSHLGLYLIDCSRAVCQPEDTTRHR